MNAVILTNKNEPLKVEELEKPVLEKGQALVKIKAAALNRRDFWIQKGQYAGLKFPIVLGSDGAGIVEAVFSDDQKSWLGKEVIINPGMNWGENEAFQSSDFTILGLPEHGTFAEYCKVDIGNLHLKPAHLNWEEAAAFPLAGLTAYRALFNRANLKKGDKLLIVGVGGGVSSFALLFANALGVDTYVTSSHSSKIDQAIAMGAKGGVDYTDPNWMAELKNKAGAFDVIIDSALGNGFSHHLDLCNSGGRIVLYGATAGNIPELNARIIFWKQLSILGSTMGSPKDFEEMLDFINQYQLKPVVDSVHTFENAEKAIRMMDNSTQFGKIVLKSS